MRVVKTGSRESKGKGVEERLRDQIDQLRNQRADARRALFGVLRWVGIQPSNGHDMRAMLEARDDAKEVLQDYLPGSKGDEDV